MEWLELYECFTRRTVNLGSFLANFGTWPNVMDYLAARLPEVCPKDMLMTLQFLKRYHCIEEYLPIWGISKPTYQRRVWKTIHTMNEVLDEVKNLFHIINIIRFTGMIDFIPLVTLCSKMFSR
jgi:hypothetical protein